MKIENKMDKKALLQVARGRYDRWRQQKTESKVYMAILFALCKGKCPVCDVPMVLSFGEEGGCRSDAASLDHTIPISVALETKKWGLEIMCRKCNGIKGDSYVR